MNSLEVDLADDPAATERLGAAVGRVLRAGDVVALVGELGAGKTTFVRGLARGLGTHDPEAVASPTYLLVVEHPGATRLLHADAYLPGKLRGFLADGGLDYLLDPTGVVAVEWGDRIRNLLPSGTLWVSIDPARGGGRRVAMATSDPAVFCRVAELPKRTSQSATEPDSAPHVGAPVPRDPS